MPELYFILSRESVAPGGSLISDRPVKGVLNPDGTGYVDLVSNDLILGKSFYTIRAEYLNGSGTTTGLDLWDFVAGPDGGPVTDGFISPVGPSQLEVWISETDNPAYFWWFNPATQLLGWN